MKKSFVVGYIPVGYPEKPGPLKIEVEYTKGSLSICGSYRDGGGQCIDQLDNITSYTKNWDAEKAAKLKTIWQRWHLNDMRAECPHQRAAGWLDIAGQEVTRYNWYLDRDASAAKKAAGTAALEALKAGQPFAPTDEQAYFARLPDWCETWTPDAPPHYYAHTTGHTETKKLGWLRPDEHPDGILCKPCPVCGYKYGSSWLTEPVPAEVTNWLAAL